VAFVRQGALWAAPFDLDALVLRGEPTPVLEGLHTGGTVVGAAQYAVSEAGTLVYAPRREESPLRRLLWVDRAGQERSLALDPDAFTRVALSPDGARVAVAIENRDNPDLWVYDTARDTLTRMTFDPANDTAPVWSPDGRSLAFRSDRDGGGLFLQAPEATGTPRRLTRSSGPVHTPYAFTPDGRSLLFTEFHSYRYQRIGVVPVSGDGEIDWVLDGRFAQLRPQVSPDGRWLAYQSDESGRFEVYVRPWPQVDTGRWQVSAAGGTSPLWSRDGRELFFHDGRRLVAVRVEPGRRFSAGPPVTVLTAHPVPQRLGPVYDIAPDGRRFLIIADAVLPSTTWARWHLMHIGNWVAELRSKVGSAR
jgi:serine/threonine-protein kinase